MYLKLALLISCLAIANSQPTKERICTSLKHTEECNNLQRGNSEVNCVMVQDAVECAQRLLNGTADFGIFTAENAFHIAALRWHDLTVIKELRHVSRVNEPFDYQSVVVVRSDHIDGINNLQGMDFCHPGLPQFQRRERWTEGFLKHFERTVLPRNCNDTTGMSPAEIETSRLAEFFNSACRPGFWSQNEFEDAELKAKYPKLCELCDDTEACSYAPSQSSSHRQAIECMQKSTNGITYVALQEAKEFFDVNANVINDYKYLCPNGSYQVIANNANPCVWLTQPWSVVVSNNLKSITLSKLITQWTYFGTQSWHSTLNSLLTTSGTNSIYTVQSIVPIDDYVNPIRPIPAKIGLCQTTAIWCTHSYEEKEKCDVLTNVAMTLGILPILECSNPRSDAVSCMSDVSSGKADLVGVDSNYGFLARHVYNLTTALYEETEIEKYSSVVAVIKESDVGRIKQFEDFKDKRACFPEFGGIASIAFINVAKNRGIFKRDDCNFGALLGEYFDNSCLPGSRDIFHDPTASNPENLCSLCQTQLMVTTSTLAPHKPLAGALNEDDKVNYDDDGDLRETTDGIEGDEDIPFAPNRAINCAASTTNRFYGTRGAITCLNEVGDIAIVEHQNLQEHARSLNLNPNNFRILCRNGSLASETGFDVDASCMLTTIVDGEIVVRRNNPRNVGIINALLSLDRYLQTDPDFKMYNIFSGEKNLLFEDSALGLVMPNSSSLSTSVQSYIKLFEDVENCIAETSGVPLITYNLLLSFMLILFTIIIRN